MNIFFNNNIIDMVFIFVYKLYYRFINILFINMYDIIVLIGDKMLFVGSGWLVVSSEDVYGWCIFFGFVECK